MKFDQDLRLNLRYDFGKMNSTLGSVVPLTMFNLNKRHDLFREHKFTLGSCEAVRGMSSPSEP